LVGKFAKSLGFARGVRGTGLQKWNFDPSWKSSMPFHFLDHISVENGPKPNLSVPLDSQITHLLDESMKSLTFIMR